jgi:hypothetical protein
MLVDSEHVAIAILQLLLRLFFGQRPANVLDDACALANVALRVSTHVVNLGFLEHQIFVLNHHLSALKRPMHSMVK